MKLADQYLLVLVSMCGLLASGVGLVTNASDLFFSPIVEEFGILKGEVSLMGSVANAAFSSIIGFTYDFSSGYRSALIMHGVMVATLTVLAPFAYTRRDTAQRA